MISAGADVVLMCVSVVFLDRSQLTAESLQWLGNCLVEAYLSPKQDEPLHDPRLIRRGFHAVVLEVLINGERHDLRFQPSKPLSNLWVAACGPKIKESGHRYFSPKTDLPTRPFIVFPGLNGQILGEFFHKLAVGPAEIWIRLSSTSGPLGRDNYIALVLEPTETNAMASGRLEFVKSTAPGDIYLDLYDLEGGNSPQGRGDHVGAY